ncbi:Hsp20/alpha crystallin family protein [Flavobacterium sp. RHBU_24]|uniref:Hsp20/alpha crystallin family protein n=1 Tax=Flavobacterium sp. RHBU_24 TaxID=3391185 RepID=UPI003985093E
MNLVKRHHSNGFPAVMDEFFKDWNGGSQLNHRAIPPVNVFETERGFSVELIAPGLKKEDFAIEVNNGLLTISTEVKTESATQEEGKFTRREFVLNAFKRTFTLPETVEEEGISAAYTDGVLKLALPKKEEALPKAKRAIEIS